MGSELRIHYRKVKEGRRLLNSRPDIFPPKSGKKQDSQNEKKRKRTGMQAVFSTSQIEQSHQRSSDSVPETRISIMASSKIIVSASTKSSGEESVYSKEEQKAILLFFSPEEDSKKAKTQKSQPQIQHLHVSSSSDVPSIILTPATPREDGQVNNNKPSKRKKTNKLIPRQKEGYLKVPVPLSRAERQAERFAEACAQRIEECPGQKRAMHNCLVRFNHARAMRDLERSGRGGRDGRGGSGGNGDGKIGNRIGVRTAGINGF